MDGHPRGGDVESLRNGLAGTLAFDSNATARFGDFGPAKFPRIAFFWVDTYNGRFPTREGLPPPAEPEQVEPLTGRPWGFAPRWWPVGRVGGATVEVDEHHILEVPIAAGLDFGAALAQRRRKNDAVAIVNVIAANVVGHRRAQLDRLNTWLRGGGSRQHDLA